MPSILPQGCSRISSGLPSPFHGTRATPSRATETIVSYPEKVCFEHALEFWTGLLVYARDVSEDSKASQLRDAAIAAVGLSPGDHEKFSIRLAS